jgi:hypothetical protein
MRLFQQGGNSQHAPKHMLDIFEPILQQFRDAHDCCMDSWCGEPLRAADIPAEDLASLLMTISRICPRTNMGLERLINEVRQSVPYSKAKPGVESLGYLGILTQLFKAHLQTGFANPLRDTREELIKEGVAVVELARAAGKDGMRKRPHLAYANHMTNLWASTNTTANEAERTQTFTDFVRKWKAFTRDEKEQTRIWIAEQCTPRQSVQSEPVDWCPQFGSGEGLGCVDLPDFIRSVRDLDSSDGSDIDGEEHASLLCHPTYGSSKWPFAPENLQAFANTETGFCRFGRKLRWNRREKLFVHDKNRIPDEITMRKRYACRARHPGLCFTEDSAIYASVLLLARNLERYLLQPSKHQYIHLQDVEKVAVGLFQRFCQTNMIHIFTQKLQCHTKYWSHGPPVTYTRDFYESRVTS